MMSEVEEEGMGVEGCRGGRREGWGVTLKRVLVGCL
jgi:hypothetical protein